MTVTEHQLKLLPPVDIMENIKNTTDGYIGYFKQYTLKSVYQPIFSFSHDTPIGFEALLRVTDIKNNAIPPMGLFESIDEITDLIQLELLSRTIHILNFFQQDTNQALLFLNINPRLINNSHRCLKQFLEMLNNYSIPPTRIVIEFIEEPYADINIMIQATKYLRQSGCLVAIDDFGAGHSNFNRVWDLRPDIVKLDKAIINRVRDNSWFIRPIKNLVELLHESESLVLIEGIEDKVDAEIAHELNIDFHQGYFFGHPEFLLPEHNKMNHYMNNSDSENRYNNIKPENNLVSEKLQTLFTQAAMGVQANISLERACEGLLNHPNVILCYMLDDRGYQLDHPVYGIHSTNNLGYRYGKLSNTKGVNWSRRIYFQKAISEPMVTQITRPYLSLTTAHLCITLSIAIETENKLKVLCCDIMFH